MCLPMCTVHFFLLMNTLLDSLLSVFVEFFSAKAAARTPVTDHWSSGQDLVLSPPGPSPISGWESQPGSKALQAEATQDLQHQCWEKEGKKAVVLQMRMGKLQSHQCISSRAQQANLRRATETRSGFYKLSTWLSTMGRDPIARRGWSGLGPLYSQSDEPPSHTKPCPEEHLRRMTEARSKDPDKWAEVAEQRRELWKSWNIFIFLFIWEKPEETALEPER